MTPATAKLSHLKFRTNDAAHTGGGLSTGLHRVQFCGEDFLLKQYRDDVAVDINILRKIVDWRLALPSQDRRTLDKLCAFPRVIVEGNSPKPVGVLIREAEPAFLISGNGRKSTHTFDDMAATHGQAKRQNRSFYEPPVRIATMGTLADLLVFLHRRGVVVGDLNQKNVLIHPPTENPAVFLVDCDSVFLKGESAFKIHDPPFLRCHWAPDDTFTPETDWFKFSLMSIRVLSGHNGVNEPDRERFAQIMRTSDADILERMRTAGCTPTEEAVELTATNWKARVNSSGRMWLHTDARREIWMPERIAVDPSPEQPQQATVTSQKQRVGTGVQLVLAILVAVAAMVVGLWLS